MAMPHLGKKNNQHLDIFKKRILNVEKYGVFFLIYVPVFCYSDFHIFSSGNEKLCEEKKQSNFP